MHTYNLLTHNYLLNFLFHQSQVGVQAKRFSSLPELIDYYREPRRGLASTLALPVQPPQEVEEEESGEL